jgi:ribosome maturation factor RimP
MIDRTVVLQMTEEYLKDSPLFLIDVLVKPGNRILVFIDGDKEVTISDCARVSRYIESNLHRDEEDFELRISSAGIDHPYKFLRQYVKNQGRPVQVVLHDGTLISGILRTANEQFIEIQQPGAGKKNNLQEGSMQQIPFVQIKETRGIIAFK